MLRSTLNVDTQIILSEKNFRFKIRGQENLQITI